MSEMVERVARGQSEFDGRPWLSMPKTERDRYMERAKLAIAAMRIPSKAMLDAVEAEEEKRGYVASAYETMDAETAWPIMIAAALSGHEEKRNGG